MRATAAAGAVAAALALGGCAAHPDSSIKVAPVGYGAVAQVVQAPANITPKAEVSFTSPADGVVAELDVADGQQVAVGQRLGRVSSAAADQQLAAAERAAAQASSAGSGIPPTPAGFSGAASAARASAAQAFARARTAAGQIGDPRLRQALLAQIAATQTSYEAAITAVSGTISSFQQGLASAAQVVSALGQAQRTQAQAAVDLARRTEDALTVTASISGTVTLGGGQNGGGGANLGDLSRLLSQNPGGSGLAQALGSGTGAGAGAPGGDTDTVIAVGSPVSGGSTLFTVTDTSVLSVTAQVDETDVLTVKPGVTARVQLNAVPGAAYPATVTVVEPGSTVSSQGGVTYTVRLSLGPGTRTDGSIAPDPLPGMSAIADLNVLTVPHALRVPSAALVTDGDSTSVWLVTGGVAHKRALRLGAQGDTAVQVLSGLTAGERIVVAGADKVHDGERVG